MEKVIIDGKECRIDGRRKLRDVLILKKAFPIEHGKAVLLTGDALEAVKYHIVFQTFAYFKKKGYLFTLYMSVPQRVESVLMQYAEKVGISNEVVCIDRQKAAEISYSEVIEAADFMGGVLYFQKQRKLVACTILSFVQNLINIFEEKQYE